MTTAAMPLSRRRFLIGSAGASLVIGMRLPLAATAAAAAVPEVNAWVVIDEDDTVTVRIARSEMGQGTLTGLAQLVAEELECAWEHVTWEFPGPAENLARNRVWGSFSTGGSHGIRSSQQYVREGGAVARELLRAAAAKRWGVDVAQCRAVDSVVHHDDSGRSLRYGELAAEAGSLPAPTTVSLKPPDRWRIAGRPLRRLDSTDKVTGALKYGADLTLPGMLHAAIHACPVHGGTRAAFDGSRARTMAGVEAVVPVADDAVAVVATTWWQAKQALERVTVDWDTGTAGKLDSAMIRTLLETGLDADDAFVGNTRGDARAALARADPTLSAQYSYPYQHHATMEPMNATALWTPERCEAWVPTQNGESALVAVAEAAGLPQQQCEVHKLILGGGFGRRAAHDFVTQAVLIAREFPGRPVKLLWSREEDMRRGYLHPVTRARLRASLDEGGNIEALHLRIAGQSILAGFFPERGKNTPDPVMFQALNPEGEHALCYDFPVLLVDHAMRNTHLRPGFWRGVNINQNVFYLESFLDELAQTAGRDPLEFRRRLLRNNPLALAVLDAVAKDADWGRELAPGRGLGLAVCKAYDSYVAACAEVSVENGRLTMHHIWSATDPGHAVNPQQIEAQVAGSFVFGLSAALFGECTVRGGRIEQENFDRYPSLTLADMPSVSVKVMPSGGFWGGVGEPTIAVAAPAVLNAVFAATGKRIRDLPLRNQLES